jgi:hypothetical protein
MHNWTNPLKHLFHFIKILLSTERSMPIFTSPAKDRFKDPKAAKKEGFSLYSLIAWLLAVDLREALDAKTGGDKSDAAWKWGL